jgi:hypothetical protein
MMGVGMAIIGVVVSEVAWELGVRDRLEEVAAEPGVLFTERLDSLDGRVAAKADEDPTGWELVAEGLRLVERYIITFP